MVGAEDMEAGQETGETVLQLQELERVRGQLAKVNARYKEEMGELQERVEQLRQENEAQDLKLAENFQHLLEQQRQIQVSKDQLRTRNTELDACQNSKAQLEERVIVLEERLRRKAEQLEKVAVELENCRRDESPVKRKSKRLAEENVVAAPGPSGTAESSLPRPAGPNAESESESAQGSRNLASITTVLDPDSGSDMDTNTDSRSTLQRESFECESCSESFVREAAYQRHVELARRRKALGVKKPCHADYFSLIETSLREKGQGAPRKRRYQLQEEQAWTPKLERDTKRVPAATTPQNEKNGGLAKGYALSHREGSGGD